MSDCCPAIRSSSFRTASDADESSGRTTSTCFAGRFIPRESILGVVETLELVEAYPDDKYFPSYLVVGRAVAAALHVLAAVDVEGDNIRIVTAYRPDPAVWQDDLRTRRPKP